MINTIQLVNIAKCQSPATVFSITNKLKLARKIDFSHRPNGFSQNSTCLGSNRTLASISIRKDDVNYSNKLHIAEAFSSNGKLPIEKTNERKIVGGIDENL